MAKQYYYFIAGLPGITLEDSKLVYSPQQFREDAEKQLSHEDLELLFLLHLPDDLSNLLSILYKNGKAHHPEGLFAEDYWVEYIEYLHQKQENRSFSCPAKFASLPRFVEDTLVEVLAQEDIPPIEDTEHALLSLFFKQTSEHHNKFIRDWFDHERNLRNVLVAINGRAHQMPFAQYLIGNDETTDNLAKSHAADFGLGKDHSVLDAVLRIYDQNNILFRERGYDILRSKWIDEQNFFEYFNIDRILGYYTKLRLIARWVNADPDLGKEIFHDTLDKLENSFTFPEDFNIKIKQK